MKYKTIFFDLDDTLIDTYQNSIEALDEVYYQYQIDKYIPQKEDFTTRYHEINNHLWDLYEHGNIAKEELKAQRFYQTLNGYMDIDQSFASKINTQFMHLVSSKVNIIPNAIEILDYLKPNYKLNILSNGFTEVQDKKIARAGMTNYFDHVILSDHIGKNKPHPDLFAHALNIAHAEANSSIMIGDNIKTDIKGAKSSNLDQVWYNPEEEADLNNISPTYTITDLIELKQLL